VSIWGYLNTRLSEELFLVNIYLGQSEASYNPF
jgi:hypothetical protein